MNSRRKWVMVIALITMALMLLCPPTVWRSKTGEYIRNYEVIFSSTNSIDMERLGIQWLAVIIVAGMAFRFLKDPDNCRR